MYPTFSDLLKDLFGLALPLPIQTFGLFVAIAFLAANYFITQELKRKETEGLLKPFFKTVVEGKPVSFNELIFNGLIGFLLGYKLLYLISNYSEFNQNPQGILLSFKGVFIGGILGAVLLVYWVYTSTKKKQLPKPVTKEVTIHPYQLMGTITVIAAIAGIIGAKVFHNLENWNDFTKDPIGSLLSFSGLTFYGGLICGAVAIIIYTRKQGISSLHLVDAAAPGLMLAYGVGRIGCHLSGDGDWGIVNTSPKPNWLNAFPDWIWSFKYPHNVLEEGVPIPGCVGNHCYQLAEPVFPTPFYEAVVCIILFLVLWSFRKRLKIPGLMFSVYLILNGIERFFIEKIRVNTLYHVFGKSFTQAELISFLLIIAGLVGIVWVFNYKKYSGKTV